MGIPDFRRFEVYAQFLKVRHKTQRRLISFHPRNWYPAQRALHQTIEAIRNRGQPVWILLLKARQEGCSSYTTARIFHATATQRNTNSLILADKKDRAEYIFEMCKTFYDHLPEVLKPTRKYSNKKELVFDNREGTGLKSGIYIATALDQFAGMGMTLHNVHISEASAFPYLGLVLTTLLPAIPPTSDTIVIVETTAKGAGTEFHEEWQKAKSGQSVFVPVFFPWFIHPEYRMKPPEEELRRGKLVLTEEERKLVKQFHLDDEQIYWRRYMIKQVYREDEESFAQEYPATDEEAFIVAGNCYFDKARLKEALVNCTDPRKQLEVETALRSPYDLVYRLREHDRGRLWVWHEPQKGHRYRMGVDVAEGKGQDYSAIEVFDETTMEQVAEWMDNTVDPISFARIFVAIAKWYNNATVAIEINGPGLATQNEAKRFYYNFYFHQYIDRFTNRRTDKLGWLTTPTFKRYLLSYMEHVIDHGVWKFNSSRLVGQLMTFVHSGDLAEAAPGCFDDLVMSCAIALYTAYQDGTIFWDKQEATGERIIDQKRDILDLSPPPDYDSWWQEKEQEEHWLAL